MRRLTVMFLAVTVLALAAFPAAAAELTVEDELAFVEAEFKVESASRRVQRTTEAPASVTVVTSEEIRRYGYRNIDDLLRVVAGFQVTNDRNYSLAAVRGFGLPSDFNSRVLLLLDGHPLNEPIYGSALLGWESGLALGEVEKVEIVRGPSSALYGTSALFGIINVVTKAAGGPFSGEAHLMLGEPGVVRPAIRARGEAAGLSFAADLHALEREGHRFLEYPEWAPVDDDGDGLPDFDGVAREDDAEEANGFHGTLGWKKLTVTGFHSDRDKTVPTASYYTIFGTDREVTSDTRQFLTVGWRDSLGPLEWKAGLSADRYVYDGWYPYPYNYEYVPGYQKPPYTVMRDDHEATWWGAKAQMSIAPLPGQNLILGLEYNRCQASMLTMDLDPAYVYQDQDFDFFSFSAYLQDEIDLGPLATLVVGANYSLYDRDLLKGDAERINPRVALIGKLGAADTLKLLYGEAFKAPTLYELYYNDGGFTALPNPGLDPEVMRTAEIILEHHFTSTLALRASAYYNRMEKLIRGVEVEEGLVQFQNSPDEVTSRGLEVAIREVAASRWSGYLSAAVQRTVDEGTDEEPPNSPKFSANAGVSVPLGPPGVHLSVDGRYVGERRTVDLHGELPAFTVVDATLRAVELAPNLEVTFSVYNLLDREYDDPASFDHLQRSIPQDGRTFGVQAFYRF